MRRIKALPIILLFALLLVIPCCFSSRQEAFQLDEGSWLLFIGNIEGAAVSVHQDGKPVWTHIEIDEDKRYGIKPGVYEILVTRDGQKVVHRQIFLDEGKTAEIRVP